MTKAFNHPWRLLSMNTLALLLILASVPFAPQSTSAQSEKRINLELIVDQSGSMAAETDTGVLRIDAARTVLNEVIDQIPDEDGVNVGFRVYGHRGNNQPEGQAESCVSSDLLVPMEGVDKAALNAQVNALVPVGWTPLGYSLEQAAADFTEPASENVVNAIIMVTDGLETCGADPAAIAGDLMNSEAGITTHVIGFGTKPEELAILEGITQASGGQLLSSENAGQLMDALFEILEELDVVEETGSGTSKASPIALGRTGEIGGYEITVLSSSPSATPSDSSGGVDFNARISATYRGSQFGEVGRDLDFTAVGESSIRYQLSEFGCPNSERVPNSPKLFDGGSTEFNVCWTVAPADTDTMLLAISVSRGEPSEKIWFALGRTTPKISEEASTEVEVLAQDILFSPDVVTIPANTDVSMIVYNEGQLEHSFLVDALSIDTGGIPSGQSATVVINVPAGTYEFYCNVPGHKEAGQTGTLVVE